MTPPPKKTDLMTCRVGYVHSVIFMSCTSGGEDGGPPPVFLANMRTLSGTTTAEPLVIRHAFRASVISARLMHFMCVLHLNVVWLMVIVFFFTPRTVAPGDFFRANIFSILKVLILCFVGKMVGMHQKPPLEKKIHHELLKIVLAPRLVCCLNTL